VTFYCAICSALRIPSDEIYITTPPSPEDDPERHIKTDLEAPQASSVSQYFEHNYQNEREVPAFHPDQYSPFLFTGPLILMETPDGPVPVRIVKKSENIQADEQQQEETYDVYRPKASDNPQFVDMVAPSEDQPEPNYYAIKPKKNKKYSEIDEKKPKKKESNELKNQIVKIDEAASHQHPKLSTKLSNESETVRQERYLDRAKNEGDDEYDDYDVESSEPTSRLDFQMHGIKRN
jgi:hypothetical protein